MSSDFQILQIEKPSTVKDNVKVALKNWAGLLPVDLSARILLKPNFNSNFNALTGNTTDLRLLAAVVEFLKEQGYHRIVIAEGTNSGFDREGISVIHRLFADRLAGCLGVEIADLNAWPKAIDVPLENGVIVQVASVMMEADFVISMPKLKTHYEVGMSVCLKNLIGTCIGRENKKKIHGNLPRNIVHLNRIVHPDLFIVDGIIGMEGNGPSRGMPVRFNKVLIGTNPFQLDYLCARLIGFRPDHVKTLVAAKEMGLIHQKEILEWDAVSLDGFILEFKRPKVSPWVGFVINPRFQKHLIRIRYAPIMRTICSTNFIKNIFYVTGISQERIRVEEADLSFTINRNLCNQCNKCVEYCPVGLSLEDIANGGRERCIGCLYCYSVCPTTAITLKGELGFYAEHIRLYDNTIRQIT
jgi:uncharacterized protein (DUF362 family)/ferredoxin